MNGTIGTSPAGAGLPSRRAFPGVAVTRPRRRLLGAVVGAAMLTLAVAAPAMADQPNHQACWGKDRSLYAHTLDNSGQVVAAFAHLWGGFATGLAGHKAGLVPDEVVPNSCND